ncbi:hypothetical protein LCGC14_0384990 [marine sediment metagenome]|uniref:Uncharacterized protein n=1 Tax=marine sediment metagenome TaxID=412755 RepID=A0A0F9TJB6_9ZZZZ
MDRPVLYKVIITAPDGRFGTKVLEGLDKRTAEFEKKRYRELGMVARIIKILKVS